MDYGGRAARMKADESRRRELELSQMPVRCTKPKAEATFPMPWTAHQSRAWLLLWTLFATYHPPTNANWTRHLESGNLDTAQLHKPPPFSLRLTTNPPQLSRLEYSYILSFLRLKRLRSLLGRPSRHHHVAHLAALSTRPAGLWRISGMCHPPPLRVTDSFPNYMTNYHALHRSPSRTSEL